MTATRTNSGNLRTRTAQSPTSLFPSFYDPSKASSWDYSPNHRELFKAAKSFREQHGIRAAGNDRFRNHLLLIDVQRDFCFPEGTLFVGGRSGTGAIDDSRRTAEFIYNNMGVITEITPTMDTHFPFQIFFPSFWNDENGNPLLPHDQIDGELTIIRERKPAGKASVNPAVAGFIVNGNYNWIQAFAAHYCKSLADGGRYMLYIWPEHCMIGSVGHALVGVVDEARMFHAYVRNIQSTVEVKGGNPLTENYSVLAPEVLMRQDGETLASMNTRFLEKLMDADRLIIAGQAASHCVKSTIDHILEHILTNDATLAKKIYILRNCTSAVAVPDGKGGFFVDFTPQAEDALKRYAAAGMNIVDSTTPIANW